MVALPRGTLTLLCADIESSTSSYDSLAASTGPCSRSIGRCSPTRSKPITGVLSQYQETRPSPSSSGRPTRWRRRRWSNGASSVTSGRTASSCQVRIGLHTGEPTVVNETYVGLDIQRAARICAAGHGGQVLLSQSTYSLVRTRPPASVSLQIWVRID